MNGRTRKRALALGSLIAAPMASAEAAEAKLTVGDGGGGTTTATEPSPTPDATPPVGKRTPARTVIPPAPSRSIRAVEHEAEQKAERDVPPPAPTRSIRVAEREAERSSPPPATDPPPAPSRSIRVAEREADRKAERKVIDVEAPPIGVQSRPPGVPAGADAAERYLRTEQGQPPTYADDRRKPVPLPGAGSTTAAEREMQRRDGATPTTYADDRRDPLPSPPTVSEEPNDVEYGSSTLPGPGDRPGESTEDRIAEHEDSDDGGIGFPAMPDLDMPDIDMPDLDMPDIDPEWVTNPRGKLAEEQEDAGEAVAEGITTTAQTTRAWMDQRPMCAGGTVYRYGGGGGEVCIDTRSGETSWKGQLGVGSGGTFKVHRPESLPQNLYCGGGVTVSSPVVYGTYERRYDFTENRWYNAYEYGVSVPYKGTKYLPVDGGSWRPSKGRHVAGRGDRKPPTGAAPRHRATPSPGKIATSYAKPSSAAAYGVCGGPGPDLY